MFVVTNRVFVSPGWESQFEDRFQKRAGQIDKQDGFVNMYVMRPCSEETPFVVMTMWNNKEAFLNWVESEDFKQSHSNPLPKEAYGKGGGMEQFDVVVSS